MEELRERVEAYHEARERELWHAHSGRVREPGLDELYERFADLAWGEPLDALRASRDARTLAGGREADERLIGLVEDALLAARAWSLGAELRARGSALEARAADELREERFARLGEERRRRLGYAHGRARVAARFPAVDVDAWARGAERLLEATESAWRDQLPAAFARARIDAADARPDDVLSLAGSSVADSFLPRERRAECLDHLTAGLGLALERSPGVSLDDEPRPGRAPTPGCFGVRVPGQVVVSAAPAGGLAAHAGLFAAAACAHALAFTSAELPVERRRGRDPGLPWGWGFLLAERADDPVWMRESPAQARADELVREAELRRLLALRELCGRVLLECELSLVPGGDGPHRLAQHAAELRERALGVPATPAGYLAGRGAELASLHELRGRAFAAQLAEWLRERHGRAFWKERRAGELLKELWHTGATYGPEALAADLGFAPLDPEHLARLAR